MLFDFHLRPLDEIPAWPDGEQLMLHWFGLTDGWYWLNVDTATLFRYTDAMLDYWDVPITEDRYRSYVDYHVVRLWEDVQTMFSAILEPIPERVLTRLQPGHQAVLWKNDLVNRLLPDHGDVPDQVTDRLDQATGWLDARWLDVGYLRAGPRIWLWNDGDTISIHWDNRAITIDGLAVWTATHGTFTLPRSVFLDEVRAFDQRLIDAMQQRVSLAQQHWSRPDVRIDFPRLALEQRDRATWMQQALARVTHASTTPWDDVVVTYDQWVQGLL